MYTYSRFLSILLRRLPLLYPPITEGRQQGAGHVQRAQRARPVQVCRGPPRVHQRDGRNGNPTHRGRAGAAKVGPRTAWRQQQREPGLGRGRRRGLRWPVPPSPSR